MRIFLLALATALAGLQLPPAQSVEGLVEGTVRHAGTSQPIPDVQITLSPLTSIPANVQALPEGLQLTRTLLDLLNAPPLAGAAPTSVPVPRATGPMPPLRAVTDATGRFTFQNVPAGQYSLTAQRDGYVGFSGFPSYDFAGPGGAITTPLSLGPGRKAPEISIVLARGVVINGVVRYPNGNPAPSVTVGASTWIYQQDGRLTLSTVLSKPTNDRGEYRLFWLPPGDYLIGATPPAPTTVATGQDSYVRTFLPNMMDPRSAPITSLREDSDLSGLDITLQKRSNVSISGRLMNAIPSTNQNAPTSPLVYLVPLDPGLVFGPNQTYGNGAPDQANGRFELRGVAAGSYTLIATANDVRGAVPTRTRVDVGNTDVTDVTLAIHSGVDIRVRVSYRGGALSSGAVPIPRIVPRESHLVPPLRAIPSVLQTPGDPAAIATISNVPEGLFGFEMTGLPAGAYIEDVRQDSKSIYDQGLIVGLESPGPIEIVVNLAGGRIEGTVVNTAQKAVMGLRVALVPEPTRRGNPSLYSAAISDLSGRFVFQGIPPGEYSIFVWEEAPSGNAHLNPEFMAKYGAQGQQVVVTPSGRLEIQVRAIPAATSR